MPYQGSSTWTFILTSADSQALSLHRMQRQRRLRGQDTAQVKAEISPPSSLYAMQEQQKPQDQEMLRGSGPRGLQAASMAPVPAASNPSLMGEHIWLRLRPGASTVRGCRDPDPGEASGGEWILTVETPAPAEP